MSQSTKLNNIYNIKSNYNFLSTLAFWVLENYPDIGDLKNATILLPSRRACRQLRQIFLQNQNSANLPKIIAIGDVDYDDLDFFEENQDIFTQSAIANQTLLIQEIKSWNEKTNLFGKNISTAGICEIAIHLQSFLDEVEKENLNLDDLSSVEGADLASHKQQILQFLRHFGSNWQNILAKNNLISIAKHRNLAIESYRRNLEKSQNKYPILACGSTGSVLATSNLLKTIASLPHGKLILFGLDKNLDEKIWQKIDETHPQFMLKKLLDKIAINRSGIEEINYPQFKQADEKINNFSSQIMLPAEYTDGWQNFSPLYPLSPCHSRESGNPGKTKTELDSRLRGNDIGGGNDTDGGLALNNIKIICAKDNFEEAKTIAQILKNTNKTAALISNDENLIENVKANLSQWQIKIDDWKSNNLAASSLANYLFLISEFAINFNCLNLLAILKHPLTKISDKENLLALEMQILRGVVSFNNFEQIIFSARNNEELVNFLQKISEIFSPLQKEFSKHENSFSKLLEAHFNCTGALALDRHPSESWDPFLEFYQNIKPQTTNFHLEPSSYNHILKNFLKNYQPKQTQNNQPNLHILSTMEARLMNYDLTIIAGLVEGEFPNHSEDWLGNKIRTDFGLPNLNKKIGIAAYDFCNYLGSKNVILTYPQNKNNAPTLKSRFLFRMEAVMKIDNINWNEYKEVIANPFLPDTTAQTRKRPQPKSPINLSKISATDISKWLRDPYFIYAKRILQLTPLKQIEQEPSFAEFGNFIHKVFENFVKDYPKIAEEKRLETLINTYGKKTFSIYFPDPKSKLLWWPRFKNIAAWFVKEEEKLREKCSQVFTEVPAQAIIGNVEINTKIDRINLYNDGTAEIIDYKTGLLPTPKEVRSGLEPQLAVEAVILSLGGVKKINLEQIKELQYWQLRGRDQNEIKIYDDAKELTKAAQEGLEKLINIFSDQNHSYICCPNFDIYKENDYYHLSRIGEWK